MPSWLSEVGVPNHKREVELTLNAAYYSPKLSGLTQKVKSGLMQRMWSGETRKNLWTLLAKAYTDLRDNHQEPVPLDKFLAIAVTQVPVIPACAYLVRMGWELSTDEAGEKTLMRAANFDAAALNAEYPAQTNNSVLDLINHCYKVGLLQRSARVGRKAAVTFATAPATTVSAQKPPAASRDVRVFDVSLFVPPETAVTDSSRQLEQELTQLLGADEALLAGSSSDFDFNNMSMDLRPDYQPSINDITVDQQRAYERTPFALHFHPQIQPPVLGFDPNIIQDDFDPFTLNADVGGF